MKYMTEGAEEVKKDNSKVHIGCVRDVDSSNYVFVVTAKVGLTSS